MLRTQQHGGDQRPIDPRQWGEAKRTAGPGEWERYPDRTDRQDRCGDERWTRPLSMKGILGRTDDMNYKRLREQQFHEPSGLKERRIAQASNTNSIIA